MCEDFCLRFLVLLLVFCFSRGGGVWAASSYCTEGRQYDKELKKYLDQKILCTHGCCGSYPHHNCCQFSVEAVAGALSAVIVGLAVLILLVCCCVKKHGHSSRSAVRPTPGGVNPGWGWSDNARMVDPHHPYPHRPRTPHWTNINVVYTGAYGQFPAFAWSRPRRVTPIKPPPYLDADSPPPPYSLSHPFCSSPSPLPGQSGEDPLPYIPSAPSPYDHGPSTSDGTSSGPGPSNRSPGDIFPGSTDLRTSALFSGAGSSSHSPPQHHRPPGDGSSSRDRSLHSSGPQGGGGGEGVEAPPSYTPPLPGALIVNPGCEEGVNLPGMFDDGLMSRFHPNVDGSADEDDGEEEEDEEDLTPRDEGGGGSG